MNQDTQTFMNLVLNNADPKLMVIDIAAHEQRMTEHRAARDKAQPPKPQPARVEYNQLRQQLYDLQQHAKHTEDYCNTQVAEVKLLERRIDDVLKLKKSAVEEGNLRGERNYENQIQMLETTLFDAKKELTRATVQSGRAGRGLKAFAGRQRIEELKAELGIA